MAPPGDAAAVGGGGGRGGVGGGATDGGSGSVAGIGAAPSTGAAASSSQSQQYANLDARHTAMHLMAGGMARCTAAVIMFPFDVVKSRLQFQGSSNTVKRYSSPLNAFRTIWIEEGPRAFTRGLSVRLLYITPSAAVSFAFYEYFKTVFLAWRSGASFSSWTKARRREHLQHEQAASVDASQATVADDDDDDDDSTSLSIFHPLAPLVAGAMARLVGTACRTPFDIIKARLQIQGSLKERKYSGTFDAFRKVIRQEGFKALWTGYASSVLRDAPFASIYFFSYEYCKVLQSQLKDAPLTTHNHLLAGALAGGVAATCTIPFDVVKTRLQTQATLPKNEQRYTGVLQAFRTIYNEEGPIGFTRGLAPRIMYLMPAASLTFACYEAYKKLLLYLYTNA